MERRQEEEVFPENLSSQTELCRPTEMVASTECIFEQWKVEKEEVEESHDGSTHRVFIHSGGASQGGEENRVTITE